VGPSGVRSYDRICRAEESLSADEGRRLGWERFAAVCAIRERFARGELVALDGCHDYLLDYDVLDHPVEEMTGANQVEFEVMSTGGQNEDFKIPKMATGARREQTDVNNLKGPAVQQQFPTSTTTGRSEAAPPDTSAAWRSLKQVPRELDSQLKDILEQLQSLDAKAEGTGWLPSSTQLSEVVNQAVTLARAEEVRLERERKANEAAEKARKKAERKAKKAAKLLQKAVGVHY